MEQDSDIKLSTHLLQLIRREHEDVLQLAGMLLVRVPDGEELGGCILEHKDDQAQVLLAAGGSYDRSPHRTGMHIWGFQSRD